MIFKTLTVSGLKSFKQEQTFEFPSKPGLYFMFGRNDAEPRMGSNGAGKSSLWDLLCWVLYGKTLRGQKADAVKTWDSKPPHAGELVFELAGVEHTLFRSMGRPNKLEYDGEAITDEEVSQFFPLPFEAFLYSVVFGQKNVKFLDMKAADKLRLFTNLLDLDEWLERSKKASKLYDNVRERYEDVRRELSGLEGQVKQLQQTLEGYRKQAVGWKEDVAEEVAEYRSTIRDLLLEARDLNSKLPLLAAHLESLEAEAKQVLEERSAVYVKMTNTANQLDTTNKQIGETSGRKNVAMKAYQSFAKFTKHSKDPESVVCDVCQQGVDPSHVRKRLVVLKKEWRDATKPMKRLVRRRKDLEERASSLKKETHRIDGRLNALHRDISEVKRDKDTVRKHLLQVGNDIEKAKKRKEALQRKNNPFKKLETETLEDLYDLNRNIEALRRVVSKQEMELEYSKYWIKGFREVRLYLVSEFLTQFEVEANNHLSKLGMDEWGLAFDVEAETKSKTIKKGFSVMVSSPHNTKPVPWESWSGGESQRLLLAGSIGLSNLIFSKYGVFPNIEVWDEPSSWLSEEGIHDLLDTLAFRAVQEQKQVWVADQRFLEYGNFDNMITVVKDKKGSHIEYQN